MFHSVSGQIIGSEVSKGNGQVYGDVECEELHAPASLSASFPVQNGEEEDLHQCCAATANVR